MNQTLTAAEVEPQTTSWKRWVRLLAPSRVVGIDIARGLALLGMIAAHILPLTDDDGFATPVGLIVSGRSSALFCLIAGIALAITSPGPDEPKRRGVKTGIWVRGIVLALVGLILTSFFYANIAIILVNYGVLFMLGAFFLRIRFRYIAPLAAVWLVAAPLTSHIIRQYLPPFHGVQPSFETIVHESHLASDIPQWLHRVVEVNFTGYYPVYVWLGYFLLGVAIGRLPLRKATTGLGLFFTGIIAVTTVWAADRALGDWTTNGRLQVPLDFITSDGTTSMASQREFLEAGYYGTVPTNTWWWQLVNAPHSGTVMNNIDIMGSSLLVVGFFIALTAVWPFTRFLLWPFAAAGSMTFTLYTAHVVVQHYFGGGALGHNQDLGYYLLQTGVFVIFATLWSLTALRGPMEGLTRLCAKSIVWVLWPPTGKTPDHADVPAPPKDSVHPPEDAPLTDSIPVVVPRSRNEPLA